MSETFFENPIYVYLSLVVAELVLAAIWYERRSRRLLRAMLIPVILGILLAAVEHFVVTDRERILAGIAEITAAVEDRQLERIPPHIDDEFSIDVGLASRSLRKDDVVDACKQEIQRYAITSVKLGRAELEVTGMTAKMHAMTMVHYGGEGAQKIPLIWEVLWIKRSEGWKVLKVTDMRQGVRF